MEYYYKFLGLPVNAPLVQIRSAYRKLAMKWVPQKNRQLIVARLRVFIELAEAYDVLVSSDIYMACGNKEELLEPNPEDEGVDKSKKRTRFGRNPYVTLKIAFTDSLVRGPSVDGDSVVIYDYNNVNNEYVCKLTADYSTKDRLGEVIQIAKIFPMYGTMYNVDGRNHYKRNVVNGQIFVTQIIYEDGFKIVRSFVDGVIQGWTIFDGQFSMVYNMQDDLNTIF